MWNQSDINVERSSAGAALLPEPPRHVGKFSKLGCTACTLTCSQCSLHSVEST